MTRKQKPIEVTEIVEVKGNIEDMGGGVVMVGRKHIIKGEVEVVEVGYIPKGKFLDLTKGLEVVEDAEALIKKRR